MRRMLVCFALAAVLITASSVQALVVAFRPPVSQQLAQADAIVVGRVIGLEPMDVQAAPAANQAKVNYRIAVVQVSEIVFGVKKDDKMVRVGFIAAPVNGNPNVQPQPGIQIQIQPIQPGIGRRPFPGFGGVNLQVGQDGLFMLAKHHKESFYTVPGYNSFITSQNNPNFATELRNTKEFSKVLKNTAAALKSDDRQQRFMAAAVLISKYRSNPTGQPMKQEPISAEESKLILKALAGADWTVNRTSTTLPTAQDLFNQLGVNANDGYKLVNVRTQQDINTAMQKWLNENESKYIIKKMVVDPDAKPQPIVQPQPGVIPPNVKPGVRPLPIKKKAAPIKGGVLPVQPQPLPAPAPPLRIQPIEIDPVQGVPQVLPIRRE